MITPEKLLESAKELETQLRTWRRTLHRHPEVGFDLPKTGDHGTWMYSVGGVLLMTAAAGAMFFALRKRSTAA